MSWTKAVAILIFFDLTYYLFKEITYKLKQSPNFKPKLIATTLAGTEGKV